ncbi:MAG: helix-turn-helix transcriptional regulator [Balneolales bacterium]
MKNKQGVQEAFGKVLAEIRKAKKLKQAELAEKSQMDVTYISDLERGLYMLAEGLGVSFQEVASK